MYTYTKRYHRLAFSNDLVSMQQARIKSDVMKSISLLTRYLDVKNDTSLHEDYLKWLKRKEIKWTYKTSLNNYLTAKVLSLESVLKSVKTLPIRYKIFALFCLVTGLRTDEAIKAFNNHKSLCQNNIMELFWDRGTKRANAVFCHPKLHELIIYPISKRFYVYVNRENVGFELRFLRKLNFTINATKVDALLADFMQGRRGNVSQRHYFLPSMLEHKSKWLKVWSKILSLTV